MLTVVWVAVALLAPAGVLVLAGSFTRDRAQGNFFDDLRGGLRHKENREPGIFASARQELSDVAEVESTRVDDLFQVGRPAESDYLDPEDFARKVGRLTRSH